ncbi:MAG TPA: hypothetical protein VFT65_00420, partial [Candidatus Angelobacter sp.]|nr:hypothetical protein [Candidatus Angelobacter sp.]
IQQSKQRSEKSSSMDKLLVRFLLQLGSGQVSHLKSEQVGMRWVALGEGYSDALNPSSSNAPLAFASVLFRGNFDFIATRSQP